MGNTKNITPPFNAVPVASDLQEGETVVYNGVVYQKINGKIQTVNRAGGIVQSEDEAEPTVANDSFKIWMANAGGTKDSTTYETGDVLLTVNSGGTSKTLILADFSAL